jgi:cytochrome P450
MLHAKLEDGRTAMPRSEAITHLNEMIAGGTETTANAIAHIVLQLDDLPDKKARLLADPSLWEKAVEEGLRRRPVAIGMFREDLTFGKGRHFCLGAPLAKMEARVGLEVLYERLPDIRVTPGQELRYHPAMTAFMLRGLQTTWSRSVPRQDTAE